MSASDPQLPRIDAPPLRLLALESRALLEAADFLLRGPQLHGLPKGDGHPVMVVPGFGASDTATAAMRSALEQLGYAVHGWDCGRNLGMRSRVKVALSQRLEQLHERYDERVSLIGWSLGGVFVREIARHQSALVRRVITLGSPFNGHPEANNMVTLFKLANRGKPVKTDLDGFLKRRAPPPVPCTAIYTRSDGIVAWPCSVEQKSALTESVEVRGSHMGMMFNREVLRVIAERLAIPPRA